MSRNYDGCNFCRTIDFGFGALAILSALGLGYAITAESALLSEFPGGEYDLPHVVALIAGISSGFTGVIHIQTALKN